MKHACFVLVVVLFVPATVVAATIAAPAAPMTYGTTSETAYDVSAQELVPITSDVTYGYFLAGRYTTAAGGAFESTLRLPEGSSITRIVLDACDNSSSGEVQAWIERCVSPFNSCLILATAATTIPFVDGGACESVEAVLQTPETVNNASNVYIVHAQNDGSYTMQTRTNAVRIFYKLQVSPPPQTATFTDVPLGSPLNKFVEALVAAGITAGCGNGNYCPNDPVTRGQMAVFLSVALGLHWAP